MCLGFSLERFVQIDRFENWPLITFIETRHIEDYASACHAMQCLWSRFISSTNCELNDNETISSLRVRRISLFVVTFPADHWRNHTTAVIVRHVSIATPTRRKLCSRSHSCSWVPSIQFTFYEPSDPCHPIGCPSTFLVRTIINHE